MPFWRSLPQRSHRPHDRRAPDPARRLQDHHRAVHAGAILPGVVGGVAAILAIVSLANLPVNIAKACA